MTKGREICNALKDIRQQIADKNEIEYATTECHFEEDCQGTCPKCEAEVKFLETELHKRRQLGKAVSIAGIATVSLGMAVASLSSCSNESEVLLGKPDTTYYDTIRMNGDIDYEDTMPPADWNGDK